jgi:hypothetical protein
MSPLQMAQVLMLLSIAALGLALTVDRRNLCEREVRQLIRRWQRLENAFLLLPRSRTLRVEHDLNSQASHRLLRINYF